MKKLNSPDMLAKGWKENILGRVDFRQGSFVKSEHGKVDELTSLSIGN